MTPSQEEYRTIPLTRGQVAIVDAADYEWLSQHKWYARRVSRGYFYAATHGARTKSTKKSYETVFMHRMILGLTAKDGICGDHINRDTLDNRRSNLRVATVAQNAVNARACSTNRCGLKGVAWSNTYHRWFSYIRANGKRHYVGCFKTPEAAHAAYREASLKFHGEFAPIEYRDGTEILWTPETGSTEITAL